jgi:hypothetical protein
MVTRLLGAAGLLWLGACGGVVGGKDRVDAAVEPPPADAAIDAQAPPAIDAPSGPPMITCMDHPLGGAFIRQAAAKRDIVPGGAIALGKYTLTRHFGGSDLVMGVATVVQDGNEIFLRFFQKFDAGLEIRGTKWLQPTADGNIKLTELCQPGRVGTVETGTYQMVVNPRDLYLDLGATQLGYSHD